MIDFDRLTTSRAELLFLVLAERVEVAWLRL